jgi:membrane-bound ClpP family serine protease
MWLAIGLAGAGVLAIIIEFFVPSAGLIGIAGLGSIIASIVIVYRTIGSLVGTIYLRYSLCCILSSSPVL